MGEGWGEILYSHGTNWKKGICISISPQFNSFHTEYSCSNAKGQIILANIRTVLHFYPAKGQKIGNYVILCSFCKKLRGIYFLLHCNFDENFLTSIEMPAFYEQILSFFLELKTIYDINRDQELILFNMKKFDQEVYSICDILDSSGMYLNFADFC